MADPLTLLRQYHTNAKTEEIRLEDGHIIFGDLAWPKEVKTNFKVYGSESDYYTLECLLYFLKNIKRSHPDYVKQAKGEVPIVHRPDRRDLIGYLEGNIQKKDLRSLDLSAPLQMPTNFKRTASQANLNKVQESGDKSYAANDELLLSTGVSGGPPGAKKPRLEGNQSDLLKERLAAKLDAPAEGKLSINKANLKNLSDDLTTDKIAEIRAKLISNRRTRIKPEDDEGGKVSNLAIGLNDLEVNRESRDIFSRERVWRTRTSILQSTGKTFNKTVNAILSSVKAREEGKLGHKGAPQMTPRPSGLGGGQMPPPPAQTRQSLPNYNRYDQEQFRGKDDTHGFNIETMGTFSGMTLKSVTEGGPQGGGGHPGRGGKNPNMPGHPKGPNAKPGGQSSGQSGGKRPSRTPIIIIPAAPKSLVSMYNAKDILQDLKFISTEDKKLQGGKRDNELLIQRRKEGGLTVPYRVIDNPNKLTNADWDRVVAVFVMGQAWQFKGWPWEGNPTVIFSKICAFHLKWDESILEKNIGNWAVSVIQLSREKRHLDRAKLMSFWEHLDRYMANNKPHLRF